MRTRIAPVVQRDFVVTSIAVIRDAYTAQGRRAERLVLSRMRRMHFDVRFQRIIFNLELLVLPDVRKTEHLGRTFAEDFGGGMRVEAAVLLQLPLEDRCLLVGELNVSRGLRG